MLPPFIIEQIRKREEKESAKEQRPRLEIPLPELPAAEQRPPEEEANRGVVIIDLMA